MSMKARISSGAEALRLLIGYRLPPEKQQAVKAAGEEMGARTLFTRDGESPICEIAEGTAEPGRDCGGEGECLLIAGFGREELDALLAELRNAGAVIPLKAAYTPHNRGWSFSRLAKELAAEHEYMRAQAAAKTKGK